MRDHLSRSRSLSRKRPWRFLEKVEWSGTRPSRPKRQNQRYGGPGSAVSATHQAALLTALNCGRRTFLGGVTVSGALDAPLAVAVTPGETLREAVEALQGRVIAAIRIADGPPQRIHDKGQQHMPGEEAWLVGEWRSSGERKYYLSNLPVGASLTKLAAAIKARWVCEQAHQQMKEELGLDHFEGRSWRGLHRHALMTMIAYAFLQHRRLEQAAGEKKPATADHRDLRCLRSAEPSSEHSPRYRRRQLAPTAEGPSGDHQPNSAKVVIVKPPICPPPGANSLLERQQNNAHGGMPECTVEINQVAEADANTGLLPSRHRTNSNPFPTRLTGEVNGEVGVGVARNWCWSRQARTGHAVQGIGGRDSREEGGCHRYHRNSPSEPNAAIFGQTWIQHVQKPGFAVAHPNIAPG